MERNFLNDPEALSRFKKQLAQFAMRLRRKGKPSGFLPLRFYSGQKEEHVVMTRVRLTSGAPNSNLFGVEFEVDGFRYQFRGNKPEVDFRVTIPRIEPPLEIGEDVVRIWRAIPHLGLQFDAFESEFRRFVADWWNF